MLFDTKVAGIPCQCLVYRYNPAVPMRVTGTGYGDADPPISEEFEFRLMDRKGYPAPWLEAKCTNGDLTRLQDEFMDLINESDSSSHG